jgi:hypothetical protein
MWIYRLRQWIATNQRLVRVKRGKPPTRRASTLLRLESLEERALPAVLNVAAGSTAQLIAAIQTANADGKGDTIVLAKGATYDFTTSNNNVNGPNALPVLTGSFTIQGNGAVIERDSGSSTPAFRLFDVSSGANVTLVNATVQGGLETGMLAQGGGIFNDGGNLTLNGVDLIGNQAVGSDGAPGVGSPDGMDETGTGGTGQNGGPGGAGSDGGAGGVAQGGGLFSNGGQITLINSNVSGNLAQGGAGGEGGYGGEGGDGGPGFVGGAGGGVAGNGGIGGQGGRGGDGGAAQGGGLYLLNTTLTLKTTSIQSNQALGGTGGAGGDGGYSGGSGGVGVIAGGRRR